MGDDRQASGSLDDGRRDFEEEGAAGSGARTGHLVIRDYIKRLDERPGVYRMLGEGRGALRRQGAQPEEAGGIRTRRAASTPSASRTWSP